MNWLNLETRTRTCPEFIGAEPEQRATWLCLMLYCAEHETGGIVRNCDGWGDRRWMQTVGCTKAEAHSDCELWVWSGADLCLWGYPVQKEAEVAAMRVGGRHGGKRSGEARRKGRFEGGLEGGLERKGKERKGIGKEEGSAREDVAHDFTSASGQIRALCDACDAVTEQAWAAEIAMGRDHPAQLASAVEEFCRDEANATEPSARPTSRLRAYIRSAIRAGGNGQGAGDDGPLMGQWRRVRDDVADRIWTAKETGADIGDAIRAMRDGYKRAPKLDGRDPVTCGVDLAMNNKRAGRAKA